MLVYVQWATSDPGDFQSFELTRIPQMRSMTKKPEPIATSQLDTLAGWMADVVIQGVSFAGWDHLSCDFPGGGVVRVFAWNDDPEDYPEGPWAQVWDFADPAPDPRHGGQTNTVQTLTVYSDRQDIIDFWTGQATTGGPVTVLPWSQFPIPAANVTIHGIWMADDQWAAHEAAKTRHGWREWIK